MSRSTISTFKLFEMFPDQEAAQLYLESRLWPDGTVCPECRGREGITVRKGGRGFGLQAQAEDEGSQASQSAEEARGEKSETGVIYIIPQ